MPQYTWDNNFEAKPADADEIKYGAEEIRKLKVAIRERLELEHEFKAGTQPSHKAGRCSVMFVGTTSEINALSNPPVGSIAWDETIKRLKVYKSGSGWTVIADPFPSGTKMLFAQASAPTGWTQDTSKNDRVIRVVSGSGGGTGGSWTISGLTVEGHALTINQIPAHTHTITLQSAHREGSSGNPVLREGTGTNITTSSVGGGQAHSHGISHDGSWRPAYLDVIIATKD